MNILHVTPSYYPATKFGGPIFSMKLLNKYLRKCNYIEVVTSTAGTKYRNEVRKLDNMKINYLPFYGKENFTFSPSLIKYLLKNIDKFNLIQINSIWNFHFLIGTIFCLIYKKPYVIYPKGSLDKNAINNKRKNIKLLYLNLMKPLINRASSIIFSSNYEKKNCIDLISKKKGIVVANPVELIKSIKKNKGTKTILYLGRIAKNKGIKELLINFNKLKGDYRLVIAGEIEDKRYFQEIKKYSLNNRVIILKKQNNREKTKLIASSFCTILPSIVNENFGNSIAESLALKTPVIVSQKAGISEYIKKYQAGVVFKPDRYNLSKLLYDIKKNYIFYQNNGYKLYRSKFNSKIIAQQINSLYLKIIELHD